MSLANRSTIRKRIIILNVTLTITLLTVLTVILFYLNGEIRKGTAARSQQLLDTISDTFATEQARLANFSTVCRSDAALILGSANSLGPVYLSEQAEQIGEKLQLIGHSLPYADSAVLYIRTGEKVISQSGYVNSKNWYLDTLAPKLAPGEDLPELNDLQNGFHLYRNFSLYVCNIFNRGSIIIRLDAEKLFNLEELHLLLPDYEILILDSGSRIFAASSEEARTLFRSLDLAGLLANGISAQHQGPYRITQQEIGQTGFCYVVIGQDSVFQNQYRLNLLSILSAMVIVVICFFVILLNVKAYNPFRQLARRFGSAGRRYEVDVINDKIGELISENTQMNKLISAQRDIQLDMALSSALRLEEPPEKALLELLQSQFDQYHVLVANAQDSKGKPLLSALSGSYFSDTLGGRLVRIDAFTCAYVIPVSKEIPPPRIVNIVQETFAQYFETSRRAEDRQEDTVFIGISDASGDIRQLHEAFLQARKRMLLASLPKEGPVAVNIADSPAGDFILSLEQQNTILEYTRNKSFSELERLLDRIFFKSGCLALRDYLTLYQTLTSLLHIILSGINAGEGTAQAIKSAKAAAVYNPYYMLRLLSGDFSLINQSCAASPALPKYQVIEYIEAHYAEPLSLDIIAAEFGITPIYLSSWFKKTMGVNLSAHITSVRMEQAKLRLLENRSARIQDIAQEVGVPNISTFIRQFKNYTGATPDHFRATSGADKPIPLQEDLPGEK